MTKELRCGTAIHVRRTIHALQAQFMSPHPPRSRFGTFPTQGGRLMPPFVLFAYPSSASLTLRHHPHQGEGICRRDGHCPSAKMRCVRLFTSAEQFTTALPSIHASKMPCIDPQKLTLFACHLIRLSAPSPSRGRLMPPFVLFAYPSSASLTLRHLPHPRGKAYAAVRSFCVTSSASRHLPLKGKAFGSHAPQGNSFRLSSEE